jgi:EmrB/QacA subfamily drug resistance transporter
MSSRSRWLPLALLAGAQFVLVLDAAIVNVAMPSMGRGLGVAQDDLTWVATAYALTFGGFLLLGGRVADMAGRRRTFVVGLAVFAIASLAGGLAPNLPVLIAARAVQGLGAALVAPAALALVMTLFTDGAARGRAMAVWGAVGAGGGAAGSIAGGLLTEWLGWRSVLWVNVPIGVLAITLTPGLLPSAKGTGGRGFDLAGAVSVTGGLALLVYALVGAGKAGWGSARTLALITLAGLLIAAFVLIERRAAHPLVPLAIFRQRALTGANVLAVLHTAALMPMLFFVALYLQQVHGYSPIDAGLSILPFALALAATAQFVPRVITRHGLKVPLVLGLVSTAAGLAWFSRAWGTGGYATEIIGPAVVSGLGAAIVFVAITIAATSGVSGHEAGLASGLISTTQQMGSALGLAILVAVATARTNANPQPGLAALTQGYRAGLLGGALIAIAAAALAAVLLPSARKTAPEQGVQKPVTHPAR